MPDELEQILHFWFGVDPSAEEIERRYAQSFSVDKSYDLEITERFAPLLEPQTAAALEARCGSARAQLALIILFDQFPRNIFRAQASAFAFDSRALSHCMAGIDAAEDQTLSEFQRAFFYLPLEHAEELKYQRSCIRQFEKLLATSSSSFKPLAQQNLDSAKSHFKIIERFGRFPHRNAALNRESTQEEIAYLAGENENFGQA